MPEPTTIIVLIGPSLVAQASVRLELIIHIVLKIKTTMIKKIKETNNSGDDSILTVANW